MVTGGPAAGLIRAGRSLGSKRPARIHYSHRRNAGINYGKAVNSYATWACL